MTGTAQALTFLSWVRPQISGLATGQSGGRAQAGTAITLTEYDAAGTPGRIATKPVSFLLAGPGDVAGLQPGALARRYPAPGVTTMNRTAAPTSNWPTRPCHGATHPRPLPPEPA